MVSPAGQTKRSPLESAHVSLVMKAECDTLMCSPVQVSPAGPTHPPTYALVAGRILQYGAVLPIIGDDGKAVGELRLHATQLLYDKS